MQYRGEKSMEKQSQYGRIDTATRVIGDSPNRLYQAFMDPESLVIWMPPEGMSAKIEQFDSRVGGGYRMILSYEQGHSISGKTTDDTDGVKTKFVELIPDMKIVGTGVFDSDDPSYSGEMLMTWYFEAIDEGTKVTVIAENVPEGIKKEDHIEGLNSSLKNLDLFLLGE